MNSEEADRDKSNNQEKKKTRRTRKDEQGRDFTCPCGKSYLSYPALYTHVKTKHQGKTPKEQGGIIARVEVQEEGQQKDPLQMIRQCTEKYFPSENRQNYPGKLTNQEIKQTEQLMALWKKWEEMISNDPPTYIAGTSIDCILGNFLVEMQSKVKEQAYAYLQEFVLSLKKGLIAEKKEQNFCKQNNGSNLPYAFNDLILHNRISASMPSKKSSPINHMTLACKMLYYFGLWIFNQRYTNFSIRFNSTTQ